MSRKLTLLGMDPSFRNWGIALGELDLDTGEVRILELATIQTEKSKNKQVRTNSSDILACQDLAEAVFSWASRAQVVFVEVPVGSQSASGMKSYGVCVGLLGALQAAGYSLIQLTADSLKKQLTGTRTASKEEMMAAALALHPNLPVKRLRGEVVKKVFEHQADAIAAIHTGVRSDEFQKLLLLSRNTQ